MTKLWGGHDIAARSCCDLDIHSSDPNLAGNTLSQYGDHFCEIVLKSDLKYQSYGPNMNIVYIATYACTKFNEPSFNSF